MSTNTFDVAQRIQKLKDFKDHLQGRGALTGQTHREWLNQNVAWVSREVREAGCYSRVTLTPPPAVGGYVMKHVDPFTLTFDRLGMD